MVLVTMSTWSRSTGGATVTRILSTTSIGRPFLSTVLILAFCFFAEVMLSLKVHEIRLATSLGRFSRTGFAARSRFRAAGLLGLFRGGKLAAALGGPVGFIGRAAPRNGQRIGGDVLGDDRAGGDVGAIADAHRRDQRRVGPDEDAVADGRRMLRYAVVIAGNGAGADVGVASNARIAEIGQMVRLGPFAHHRLFQFDEVADVRARADMIVAAQSRKGPHHRAGVNAARSDHAIGFDGYAVGKLRVGEQAAGADGAARAEPRLAEELDARLDHEIGRASCRERV